MNFSSTYALLITTSPHEEKRRLLTKKARMLANLPRGFSHGEGLPVTEAAITYAEQFIFLASQLELDADVFPNLDGGCAVAFYKDSGRVEASINPEGNRVDLRVEHGIGFQFEEVLSPTENVGFTGVTDQLVRLRRFNNDIWKLSASSTSVSSTEPVDDSETLPTETHQDPKDQILRTAKGGSQSSKWLVPA